MSRSAGPDYRGALKDGAKILFRLSLATGTPARFVLAEAPIDALSLAAIEGIRAGTLYAATGGGMGPATIEAIARILAEMAGTPGAIFLQRRRRQSRRRALRPAPQELAACAGVPFERLAPQSNRATGMKSSNTKPGKGRRHDPFRFHPFEPLNRLKDEMGLPRDHYGAFLKPAISPAPGSF